MPSSLIPKYKPQKRKPERRVRIGGLYRCCVSHIETMPADQDETEGTLVRCPTCSDWLRFRNGAWEWAPSLGSSPPVTTKGQPT